MLYSLNCYRQRVLIHLWRNKQMNIFQSYWNCLECKYMCFVDWVWFIAVSQIVFVSNAYTLLDIAITNCGNFWLFTLWWIDKHEKSFSLYYGWNSFAKYLCQIVKWSPSKNYELQVRYENVVFFITIWLSLKQFKQYTWLSSDTWTCGLMPSCQYICTFFKWHRCASTICA